MKSFNGLKKEKILPIIRSALKEDIGRIDITTFATVHKLASVRSGIVARDSGIVCGIPIVELILNVMDYSIRVKPTVNEGDYVSEGKEIIFIEGRARPILMAERTMLNFLGLLSGIATKADQFVKKVEKYNVKIMDTRKTTPLLRYMEKYAVKVGGGNNHRMGLWDQILIKDNHIKVVRCSGGSACGNKPTIKEIIERVKARKQKNILIEIEVESLKEFEEAFQAGVDIIMLDNMSIEDVRAVVEMRKARNPQYKDRGPKIEVSGGITLDNVEEYAACGIDMISLGSLTKDVKCFDMALEIVG